MRASRSSPAGEFPVKLSGPGAILQAAQDGDIRVIRKRLRTSLFRKSEDVNRRDDRECTALHYAAKTSNCAIARLLLDKGADLTAEDKHGWSVLHYAVRYGKEEMLEFLIHRGADLHAKEKRGLNVLHLAARNGQADKARLLLENGANVHECQSQGWNSLHLAVRHGQPDTIITLLEYGIHIDAGNGGWTALHLAALNGHVDIASILLNKGAAYSLNNKDGQTALDIAREEGHEIIVAIIMEREFQVGNIELPTPPPTPPSGTSSKALVGNHNNLNTLEQWRLKLQKDLDDISNDDSASNFSDPLDLKNDQDGRITWKSFDEEKYELLQQLESVRLKEVNRVKDEIHSKVERHQAHMFRISKQGQLILTQIETMRKNIPTTQEMIKDKFETLKSDITQITCLIEKSLDEAELIDRLKSHQIESEYCAATSQKQVLIDQLTQVQKNEVKELKTLKTVKFREMDLCEINAEKDVQRIVKKIKVLEEELHFLGKDKVKKVKQQNEEIFKLEEELQKAERRRIVARKNEDEEQFACPVCMELLKPPSRIFQCSEGHILCENCKENPSLIHCPQCRILLEGNCSRNRALEEVARSFFPDKTCSPKM